MITLLAGQPYTVKVRVTNMSTKGGQPAAATMQISIAAVASSLPIGSGSLTYPFAAGEGKTFSFPINVPATAGAGAIVAKLLDPNGNFVNSMGVDVVIAATPIVAGRIEGFYARWEGEIYWRGILSSNSWPADKQMIIVTSIKNTGNVSADYMMIGTGIIYKSPTRILPGQTGTFEVPPFYAAGGSYTWQLYAKGENSETMDKVDEVSFAVVTY